MVDKISFLETNSNLNFQNNIVLCEDHQNKCKTFQLNSEDKNNIFKCHSCMIEEKQDYSQTVPLSQVCSFNSSTVILSWPPLDDQTLLQKVLQISQQSHPQQQTECNKISDFFDQFTTQIVQKINEKKKSLLSQAESIVDPSQSIQKVYQQIASLQELKEIIQNDKMSITQKSESISNLLLKKNLEKSRNTELIKKCLQEQNIPKFFDINILNQFKNSLFTQIEQLDYQNQSLIKNLNSFTQQFIQVQNSFNIPSQSTNYVEIENDSNLDRIIKLISNKSNQCSERYLDSVKIELNKLSNMINNLNIEREVYLPNKQQINIDFNNLNNEQIENIQVLAGKMKILNKKYNQIDRCSDVLSPQIQPSSFYVMGKIFNLQQYMPQWNKEQIEDLLRRYPIFEVEQLIKPMNQRFKIEFSKYRNSQAFAKVIYDNYGLQSFEVLTQCVYSTMAYIRINQGFKYRMRIKLHLNDIQTYFFIGLIKDEDKDSSFLSENSKVNSFNPNPANGDKGVSKVIKGKCLREVKYPSEYDEIELNFCVKKRLFEVCDYPKRQNINTINDNKLNIIDPNSIYYLGFQLGYVGDKITILEFEEENIIE